MVTKKEKYPCPVCGKMIFKQGAAGHNRSKFHLDALAKQNGIEQEPINTGIQTTVPENDNDTNKETTGRNEGRIEGSTSDSDEFTGYLC